MGRNWVTGDIQNLAEYAVTSLPVCFDNSNLHISAVCPPFLVIAYACWIFLWLLYNISRALCNADKMALLIIQCLEVLGTSPAIKYLDLR